MRSFVSQKTQANRHGATMVVVAVLLPALILFAAFAINVAHMESVRTEIQATTDAAVLAASREYLLTHDKAKALEAARDLSSRNPVNGFVVPFEASDLEYGVGYRTSASETYSFVPTGHGNAIRLTTNSLADGDRGIAPMFPFLNSRPVKPRLTAVCTQGEIDIALVVDRSGSMAYAANEVASYPPMPAAAPAGWDFGHPVPPNARWLDLVSAVEVFIDELNSSSTDERLSLTMYDEIGSRLLNLSQNYAPVITELNRISDAYDKGGTNIGAGMLEGEATLMSTTHGRPDASKVIVLMTDGVHNLGTDPNRAARWIADSGVTVFTITFSDEANQSDMERVAQRCGGSHFHAADATQLRSIFKEIARRLPALLTE